MIPRGSPDIGWRDLLFGLRDCLLPPPESAARTQAEAAFGSACGMACLSVRSGLDLALQARALAPGSEVLVSAVTIPGMIQVLAHHRLVAVPVDLDMATLAPDLADLEQALTPRTRALLVAHLCGSRIDLAPLVALARRHNLLLLEDCAQAYDGYYRGHADSDLVMFSFGPIKTSTALGGALLRFRDPAWLARARAIESTYRLQSCGAYLRRILIFLGLKALAFPLPLAAFVALCRLRGWSHDALITRMLRGFPSSDLINRLRQRPCAPLLAMLARRLRQSPSAALARRIAQARAIIAAMPERQFAGAQATPHTHWVLPLVCADPDALGRHLWALGVDASQSASSMYVVPAPPGRSPARRAAAVMDQLLYLPLHPALRGPAIDRLADAINAFERDQECDPRPTRA
ncbi:MAG: aminotransferase class I/II-fold pyridoxal phosphate-dependent enzyme [Oscillochloris sp.]|nr:aminotransferase class I/II-fold pyridoxal phosphate-dependent enzyme [Oscillochloris sp.]